jgi:ParB family transcriptional regulator, chromosome partitioning protein
MPARSTDRGLAPTAIGVKAVETDSLQPNPHNPRMLFDRLPLNTLKASIEKVGILVPLTVYMGRGQNKYTILDGQRRWMCAQELGLPRVPVNQVDEPSLVQNIVTMFQIHKLRQDWELMPTALKVEVLMDKLDERSDRKLAELTGLDQAVVTRCKKLLSYPTKYQERMLDPNADKRVKADFFIELYPVRTDRTVNKFDWYSKNRFTRRMLEKYENPKSDLKAVTDFRVMKQHITNSVRARRVQTLSKRLREYAADDEVPMSHLQIESASVAASARTLSRSIEKLTEDISEIDVERYYGAENVWQALERLLKIVRDKLGEADRRAKP